MPGCAICARQEGAAGDSCLSDRKVTSVPPARVLSPNAVSPSVTSLLTGFRPVCGCLAARGCKDPDPLASLLVCRLPASPSAADAAARPPGGEGEGLRWGREPRRPLDARHIFGPLFAIPPPPAPRFDPAKPTPSSPWRWGRSQTSRRYADWQKA